MTVNACIPKLVPPKAGCCMRLERSELGLPAPIKVQEKGERA